MASPTPGFLVPPDYLLVLRVTFVASPMTLSKAPFEVGHKFFSGPLTMDLPNGWSNMLNSGRFGNDSATLAFVAYFGRGAGGKEDIICPMTFTEGNGNAVDGGYNHAMKASTRTICSNPVTSRGDGDPTWRPMRTKPFPTRAKETLLGAWLATFLTVATYDFYFIRGRPPDLPQRESFLRCFLIVIFPPRLPMHRGQISSVSLWMGQRERRGTRDTAHILTHCQQLFN